MQLNTSLWLSLLLVTINIVNHISAYSYAKADSYAAETLVRPAYKKPPPISRYKDLIKIYEGKNLEFAFPSESVRNAALNSGQYDPDHPIPIDVDVYYPQNSDEPTVFITIPRFGSGVPYSLATLTDVQRPNGSEFQPYPDYSWHSSHGQDCDGLTSVYRIQIDACGRMWILDSGEIEFVQHCQPQVVVYDIKTGTMVHRYRLPPKVFRTGVSRFVTPLVDIDDPPPLGTCSKAFVYMADATGTSLIVYDVVNDDSWRIENRYTFPDPDFSKHTIAGESFELLDGVFGLSMTPRGLGLRRLLYFHALSNDAQVAVPLDVINNSSNFGFGLASSLDEFKLLGHRGVQCAASAMSANGFLLCGFLEPIALIGWNIRTPYTPRNRMILAENPETLQFISGLKVIRNPRGKEEVWMLSNRLQKTFSGTTDFTEINYRIQKCGMDELLLGKQCRN
ncbi:protein yellow [Lucilia cuprina]|uniref:protein yellow n=1 Tax=Lucilia cuprina TaxID=7375 RepID=UPI001F056E56|nr:protein yellow [Lucilia cuprina]